MPHTIEVTDAAGRRLATPQVVALQSAQPKELGLFLKSLGLAVSRQTNAAGQSYLAATCAGLTMTITPGTKSSELNMAPLHFAVSSLASAQAAAEAQFGQLVMKPFDTQWGKRAIVADPDGRRYFITEMSAIDEASVEVGSGEFAIAERNFSMRGGRSGSSLIEVGEFKALAAVKRGASVVLIGIVLQLIMVVASVAAIFSAFSAAAGHRGLRPPEELGEQIEMYGMFAGLGMLAVIAGKVMCGIPSSSKTSYAPLWIAIVLEVVANALGIVIRLDPKLGLEIPAVVVGLLYLAAPFLFVQFLGTIMEQVHNPTVAGFAQTTNSVYGISLAILAIGIALFYFMPQSFKVSAFAGGLIMLVYFGFYVTLLVQVLNAKANVRGSR